MICPFCQKEMSLSPTSAFVERGEWDDAEQRYDFEADVPVYECECGAEIAALNSPLPKPKSFEDIHDFSP